MINLYNADCIEQMQKMIDEGIQVESVVTDPPYELGFMGKGWDSTGIAFQKETWELCLQLLKPGGHLLAFSGSRTYHRMAVAIEDSGFEIRDQIMWIYGSGFPKSLNIGNGWGTALKPAHEPVVMARKPFKGTVANNVLQYGTGAINIDESRISLSENDDSRLGGKGTWKTDKMAKDVYEGGYAGTETGSSELGRFPANIIHDGSDVVKDIFPNNKAGSYKGDGSKSGGIWSKSTGQPAGREYGDEGSASRYFYSAKVSASERNQGLEHLETKQNTHPTVKPIDLMKYLCRLVTPKGGTVLDPFMGSGSTGIAAKSLEFDFIGIEKEEEYYKIASARVNASSPLEDFFI